MKKNTTFVSFLLDETGSMQSIKGDTVGGFNAYVETLQKCGADIVFSLVSFNSNKTTPRYVADPIDTIKPLTEDTYQPAAATPLIDASVKIINATDDAVKKRGDNPNVLIVFQTDGEENVSVEYTNADLARHGPLASLQLVRAPLSRLDLLQKRAFDFLAATSGLIAAAPFMAIIAVLIKLDSPGPVFFRQRRYGFNRKPFRILKFRTMSTLDDGAVVNQATRHDPRVTRVGRWLRRLNLDELPQLLNVIRGEMSLVGPRPHAIAHDHEFEKVVDSYACRHNVKPGITGWAQVHGFRGETNTPDKIERRLEYDLYYIENWSLARDVWILFWTVFSPTAYRNAV